MIIPVRCFSCGKPIGQLWDEFKERTDKEEDGSPCPDVNVWEEDEMIT